MTRHRPVRLAGASAGPQKVEADPGPGARRAPKRMARRCPRCGKPVPTLSGLVWRAERVLGHLDAAAHEVFELRVEGRSGALDERLKRAHDRQQDGFADAETLLADLRAVHAHGRRCHEAADRASHDRTRPPERRDATVHVMRRDRDPAP